MPIFGPPDIQHLVAKHDVKGLIKALSYEKDAGVRVSAASALGRLADAQAFEPLLALLGEPDAGLCQAAIGALGQIGDARALQPLVAMLRYPDGTPRGNAERAFHRQVLDAAGRRTVAALEEQDWHVRREAIWSLRKIGDARAVAPLIAAIGDETPRVRLAAVETLGGMGDARAVEPLIAALEDGDHEVRAAAANALAQIDDAAAVEPLVAALAASKSSVRGAAVKALARHAGDARVVQPLIAALGDPDEHVRRVAAAALGEIGDAGVVQPLIAALSDPDSDVRRGALGSLERLGWRPDQGPAGAAYWAAKGTWAKCVEIGAAAVDPLLALLSHGEHLVAPGAARALGQIGDARAVEPLIAALEKRERDTCVEAATALGSIGDPLAVEPLVAVVTSDASFWRERKAAAEGLLGLYRSGRLSARQKASLLVRREVIAQTHTDWASDCGSHGDTGTGVEFPIESQQAVGEAREADWERETPSTAAEAGTASPRADCDPTAAESEGVTPGLAETPLMVVGGEIPAAVFAALGSDDHEARQKAITVLKSSGYQDPPETRSFAVLGRAPGVEYSREELNEDVAKFPDFDIAYVRAAYPSGASEDHAHADVSLFPEALVRCTVKGRLLGRLSSYFTWAQDYLKALDYGTADVLLGDPSEGPSDMVQVLVLLAEAFEQVGLHDDAGLVGEVKAAFRLGSDEAVAVRRASTTLSSRHADDVRWAADTVRERLLRARQERQR